MNFNETCYECIECGIYKSQGIFTSMGFLCNDCNLSIEEYSTFEEHVLPSFGDTDFSEWEITVTTEKDDGDEVEDPPHYQFSDDCGEVLDVILDKDLDFCLGNVLKYVLRAGHKDETDEVTDLEKAKYYLDIAIEERDNDE